MSGEKRPHTPMLTYDEAEAWLQAWPPRTLHDPLGTEPYFRAAMALADAIRADRPKPPRMDEPGWGEKVIAGLHLVEGRRAFLCVLNGHPERCWQDEHGFVFKWDDLIDPEPVQ